jgi:hypothetical protein
MTGTDLIVNNVKSMGKFYIIFGSTTGSMEHKFHFYMYINNKKRKEKQNVLHYYQVFYLHSLFKLSLCTWFNTIY